MKNTIHCLSVKHIAQLGGLMPTYWSAFSQINNDRTPEVTGVQEDLVE